MKAILTLALLVLSSTFSIAQDTPAVKCPTVKVTGPVGNRPLGELTPYTATVSNADQYPIEYVWSVHGGQIRDGEGTSTIRVRRQAATLSVGVEVKGLPPGCPSSASESVTIDPPILPVKIYELDASVIFDKAAATRIAAVMLENPNNQLFILAGDVGRKNSPALQHKQRSIIDLLSQRGITQDRITIAPVYADVELFKFWRVPPGAENPRCEECSELEKARKGCPEISVTDPASVVEPGENMTFVATVTGTIPERTSYSWSIEGGSIIDGQGTLKLTARYPRSTKTTVTVTASLTVLGLPDGCPRTGSATYAVAIDFAPEPLGSITNPKYTIDSDLLAKIASSLRESPNSQLYVWVYLGSNDTEFPRLKARLLAQLSRTKIDPSRFTIKGTPDYGPRAAFWLLRPGVDIPLP